MVQKRQPEAKEYLVMTTKQAVSVELHGPNPSARSANHAPMMSTSQSRSYCGGELWPRSKLGQPQTVFDSVQINKGSQW